MTRCDYCGARFVGKFCDGEECAGSERGALARIGVWRVLELARLLSERGSYPWSQDGVKQALAALMCRYAKAMPIKANMAFDVWHKQFRQTDVVEVPGLNHVIWLLLGACKDFSKLFRAVAAARKRQPVEIF